MKNNKIKLIISILLISMTFNSLTVYALTKDETIFSKSSSDGTYKSIMVSEHLINDDKDEISDLTELNDIFNVNGDETYKIDGNKIKWNAKGNDIFYQGTTKSELPISMKITYKLDGETKKINEIIGKKGKIEINIKYINNLKTNKNINGNTKTLYTPFVVTTGTILDNDNYKNIKVTNAKVINTGNNNIVVGLTSPGLYESLKVNELKDFDTITISFDTNSFELNSIYTMATPKLISSDDLKIFNKLDSIYSNVDTLQSSINTIEDGSKTINDNMKKVNDGAYKLYSGLNTAYSGTEKIQNEVKKAINTLLEDKTTLDDETLNYIKSIASDTAKQQIEANENQIKASALEELKSNDTYILLSSKLAELGITNEVVNNCLSGNLSSENIPLCTSDNLFNYKLLKTLEGTATETAYQTALSTAQSVASLTAESVAKQVMNSIKETITNKVATSMGTLNSSLDSLKSGIGELKNGSNELSIGTKELSDGTNTLTTGISTFNEEGIKKLTNLVNNDIKNYASTTKALVNLSNEYKTLDKINSNTKGNSKIVIVVDSVQKKEEKKIETKEEKISFWKRITNLFK